MELFEEAQALHRAGHLEQAGAGYERVLAVEPGHFQASYYLSLVRATQGRVADGLEAARASARSAPDDWRGHAQEGGLLIMAGRPEEALRCLGRARRLAPGRADVANNIGAALRSLGRIDEARAEFEAAVTLDPGYMAAISNLASSLSALGRYDEAVVLLERLVASGLQSDELFDELGKALWKSSRSEDGVRWFRRAINLNPEAADAWGHLGNA